MSSKLMGANRNALPVAAAALASRSRRHLLRGGSKFSRQQEPSLAGDGAFVVSRVGDVNSTEGINLAIRGAGEIALY